MVYNNSIINSLIIIALDNIGGVKVSELSQNNLRLCRNECVNMCVRVNVYMCVYVHTRYTLLCTL